MRPVVRQAGARKLVAQVPPRTAKGDTAYEESDDILPPADERIPRRSGTVGRTGPDHLPAAVRAAAGRARGVEFLRTVLEDPTSRSGRVRTVPGSNFVLPADMVVKALGQEPLLELVAALPDLRCERGAIVVDPATGATSVTGLFAGGDCLRGGGEVVDAVQDGKVAARGIDAALAKESA